MTSASLAGSLVADPLSVLSSYDGNALPLSSVGQFTSGDHLPPASASKRESSGYVAKPFEASLQPSASMSSSRFGLVAFVRDGTAATFFVRGPVPLSPPAQTQQQSFQQHSHTGQTHRRTHQHRVARQ